MKVDLTKMPSLRPYVAALALIAAAVLIRWLVDPWLGNAAPLITLYGAVATAVAYGGLLPAALTSGLGYLACNFAFIEPRGTIAIPDAPGIERLALYLVTCSVIMGVGEALRIARLRAEANWRYALAKQGELELEIAKRTLAERALREADRHKDEFLAMLAHELRSPLAAVQFALQLLQYADGNADAAAEAHAVLQRQVSHLVRLADDLLDAERIAKGKVELQQQPTLLATLCQGAVEAASPLLKQMEHELTVSIPADPFYVDVDPVRMTQVLSNLLTNAAKYTPNGGHVRLSAEHVGRYVVVTVKDDGVGIGGDVLNRVFDFFTQVHLTHETSQSGLGLGLAIAKQLTELHGGNIEVKSDGPGKGSEFSVHLPAAFNSREEGRQLDVVGKRGRASGTLSCS